MSTKITILEKFKLLEDSGLSKEKILGFLTDESNKWEKYYDDPYSASKELRSELVQFWIYFSTYYAQDTTVERYRCFQGEAPILILGGLFADEVWDQISNERLSCYPQKIISDASLLANKIFSMERNIDILFLSGNKSKEMILLKKYPETEKKQRLLRVTTEICECLQNDGIIVASYLLNDYFYVFGICTNEQKNWIPVNKDELEKVMKPIFFFTKKVKYMQIDKESNRKDFGL